VTFFTPHTLPFPPPQDKTPSRVDAALVAAIMADEGEPQEEHAEGEVFEDAQDGYLVVDKEEEPETEEERQAATAVSATRHAVKVINGINPHAENNTTPNNDANNNNNLDPSGSNRTLEAEV